MSGVARKNSTKPVAALLTMRMGDRRKRASSRPPGTASAIVETVRMMVTSAPSMNRQRLSQTTDQSRVILSSRRAERRQTPVDAIDDARRGIADREIDQHGRRVDFERTVGLAGQDLRLTQKLRHGDHRGDRAVLHGDDDE